MNAWTVVNREFPPHTSTIFSMSGSAWEIRRGVRLTVMGMMSITTTCIAPRPLARNSPW